MLGCDDDGGAGVIPRRERSYGRLRFASGGFLARVREKGIHIERMLGLWAHNLGMRKMLRNEHKKKMIMRE